MSRTANPKALWLLASTAILSLAVRTSIAASSLPAFTGQLTGEASAPAEPLSLWYRQPATAWTSALPIGNGRQGAMMFGGIDSEVICLNETTLWSGGPYSPENPTSFEALPEVRKLLFDDKWKDAENLITQKMMAKPATEAAYQPVGDILLTFPKVATAENYRRELNLRTATSVSQFTADGVTYTRELFASSPDNVMVMRLTADKPGKINFKLSMQTGEPISNSDGTDDTFIINGNNRPFSGNGVTVPSSLKYQARAKILHTGGKLTKGTRDLTPPAPPASTSAPAPAARPWRRPRGGRGGGGAASNQSPSEYLRWKAPDSATILIASTTSFKISRTTSGDPNALAAAIIEKSLGKGLRGHPQGSTRRPPENV